ncbi:MAG: beta-propeller domain-containing protein [Pseudomonadota bacterium]
MFGTQFVRIYGVFVAALLVSGLGACGGGGATVDPPPPTDPPEPPVGLLAPASAQQLEQRLKSAFSSAGTATAAEGLLAVDPPSDNASDPFLNADAPAATFSTTYGVDANVAEFDIVQYDGTHLYIAPRRFCCYSVPLGVVATDASVTVPGGEPEAGLRVLATDPATATATEVARVPLPADDSVEGLFLHEGRLVTISTTLRSSPFGMDWLTVLPWGSESHRVALYATAGVADGAPPELTWSATFDGGFVQARRVGGTLHLISRYTPRLQDLVLNPQTEADFAANAALLDDVSLADLLPQVAIDGGAPSPLLNGDECLMATDEDQGFPTLTVLTSIPLNNPNAHASVCYNEFASGVYVSSRAIYLSDVRVDDGAPSGATRIHKFDLTSQSYRGSAEIEGVLWSGGQFDFRINEFEDRLRVMTSTRTDDETDVWDHQLSVLGEASAGNALEVVGRYPNTPDDPEIGKPNEALYGVRFFGPRAYAVTFEQIDPLYVLDLSDPEAPSLSGELEVTGFSDFLHPVNEDLLLGLGTSANFAVKLELFDIADISAPVSREAIVLGGSGSYSEAQYNRHAFTYLAGSADTDRFTIPASLSTLDDSYAWDRSGLFLFEIGGKSSAATATLSQVGELIVESASEEQSYPRGGSGQRAILHDDAVFFLRDGEIYSALWGTTGTPAGPQ